MKVALLNQYYAPAEAATAQLLTDLGECLAAAGHDVTAICSRRSYPDPTRVFPARETIAGVDVRRVWTTGFGRSTRLGRIVDYLGFFLGAARVLGVGRRHDLVVTLTTPPMVASLAVFLARLRGARSLFWVMDVYPDLAFALGVLRERSLPATVLRRLSGHALRGCDRVVAIGETMAAYLERSCGRSVDVVHNWADGDAIRPRGIEGHPLREGWGWSRRFVVLYSGNLGLAHEFETLLDAAQALAHRDEILFAFVGGGPRLPAVEAEVRRRGLTNVEFRPHVEREALAQSLTAGDVHLITLREGMPGLLVPSKIYGVLAAGRPAIYVGPEDGEIGAIVVGSGCGVRVGVGDVPGLVAAIVGYADDRGSRERDGDRARHLFDERFGRERSLAALRRLVEQTARGAEA